MRLIRFMVERSGRMAAIALVLIGLAGWGLTRVPTGFIPTEDQGYADGRGADARRRLARARAERHGRISRIGLDTPGAAHAIAIGTGGPSPLDGDVSLANAGIVYLMLKSWGERGKSEDLDAVTAHLAAQLAKVQEARTRVLVPAADPGTRRLERLPDAGRADRRQLRLRAAPARDRRDRAARPTPRRRSSDAFTAFRASVPQVTVKVDKTQAATRNVNVGRRLQHGPDLPRLELRQPLHALRPQLHGLSSGGSAAAPQRRGRQEPLRPQLSAARWCRSARSPRSRPRSGTTVISLYNLFPAATINGMPAAGYSSGQALAAMEGDRADECCPAA